MVECQVSKARLKDPTYSYDGEKEEAMSGNILRAVLTGICCNVALPARGVEHAMSEVEVSSELSSDRTPENATEGLESSPPLLIPYMEGGLGPG